MKTYLPLYNQLYALQVLEYEPLRFLRWTLKNPIRVKLENKKSLILTSKAKFLFISSFFIQLAATTLLSVTPEGYANAFPSGVIIFIFFVLFPQPPLIVSLILLKPYEFLNRRRTISDAQKILAQNQNLLVIGITGSYGKTTVKEILSSVLSTKYKVLATPKSYNTLFGVAGIIKKYLQPDHEIFIVEMGAYKKGEIAELCRMVKPKIGILTGITGQHLERFGTLENIVKAKRELIDALPKDGLAVFNLYSAPCADLYKKTNINKIGYSRIDKPNGIEADLQAKIIPSEDNPSSEGLSFQENEQKDLPQNFDLKISSSLLKSPTEITNLTLNLPAEHNVSNALAAIAVGLYLGLSEKDIKDGLGRLTPPEHRLQVIRGAQNSIIIDDAYSSNIEGVRAAISLVKKFNNRPKTIVTPGLVELGSKQDEENFNFGKLIGENFDYAVIVNKTNRKSLLQGISETQNSSLRGAGSDAAISSGLLLRQPADRNDTEVYVVDTLDQATKDIIPKLVKPNSLILFENDLPDIYD